MKDALFSNKLAAVVLIVLLLFIGLPVIVHTFEALLGGHHGHHEYDEENPFHLTVIPYETLVGGGEGQVEEEEISLGCLLADADPARGARAGAICTSCHSLGQNGANGTGPRMWGVVGRDIGGLEDYNGYSAAIRTFGGQWTYESLDAYLYNSASFMPGTNMAQQVRKDNKRADILAFLGTLREGDPMPFPECVPPAAEEEMAEPLGEAMESEAVEG